MTHRPWWPDQTRADALRQLLALDNEEGLLVERMRYRQTQPADKAKLALRPLQQFAAKLFRKTA